jgi:hypothetical protein
MMADFREDFLRETQGFGEDSGVSQVFAQYKIDKLSTAGAIHSKYFEPRQVFITIDPSCGGKRSKTAIVSCAFDDEENMVVSFLFLFTQMLCIHLSLSAVLSKPYSHLRVPLRNVRISY